MRDYRQNPPTFYSEGGGEGKEGGHEEGEEGIRKGGRMSEYNPAYQTPCFSNASLMHLQSSSAYSDAWHIRLHMLCNSALPPASAPPHLPPLLVCLFVYLCHRCMCCLFCLFVSPSRL